MQAERLIPARGGSRRWLSVAIVVLFLGSAANCGKSDHRRKSQPVATTSSRPNGQFSVDFSLQDDGPPGSRPSSSSYLSRGARDALRQVAPTFGGAVPLPSHTPDAFKSTVGTIAISDGDVEIVWRTDAGAFVSLSVFSTVHTTAALRTALADRGGCMEHDETVGGTVLQRSCASNDRGPALSWYANSVFYRLTMHGPESSQQVLLTVASTPIALVSG